jgi:hypothetical protein
VSDFLAGQIPTAGELELATAAGEVVNRGERVTNSTAASGAQGVLRVDGTALTAGRRYEITTNTLHITSSVAADRGVARLSMDTTGAQATTSSTVYGFANSPNIDSTTDAVNCLVRFFYTPAADQTVSVLLWTQRLSGTGNVRLIGITGNASIQLEIIDRGVDVGDTGVDI